MAPSLYKDLGKKSKDLLSKDFPIDEHPKAEIKYTGQKDLELKSTLLNDKSNNLSGTFEPKYKSGNNEVEVVVNSQRQIKGKITVKEQIEGLSSAISYDGGKENAALELEYVQDTFSLRTSYDHGLSSGNGVVYGAFVFQASDTLQLGAEAEYAVSGSGQTLQKCGGAASFNLETDYETNLIAYGTHLGAVKDKATSTFFGLRALNHRSKDLSLCADVSVDKDFQRPAALFGGAYKVDSTTSVKGVFNTADRSVGVSWKKIWSDNLTSTIAAKADTRDLQSTLAYGAFFELSFA